MKKSSLGAKRMFVFCLLFALFSFSLAVAVTTNDLSYDSAANNITLTYDNVNRVASKTSPTETVTYGYDQDLQGTVSNVTSNNIQVRYEYDDKLRVTKEIRIIDNIQFVKEYIYDSANRVISAEVSGTDIDFIFNKQGKVKQIPGYISDSHYNPFGSMLNRTYNNNLVQTFTYNSTNNRLHAISIPSVQNLAYTYDSVGNILTINDAVNNRLHNMSYDSLDRMTKAVIGTDRFAYSYNSIGNIMKLVKNNDTKHFVYNGSQTHAPSKVIEGSAGAEIYHVNETSNTKNKTIQFFLVNDKDSTLTGVNWTVTFGDGGTTSGSGITLGPDSSTLITTSRTYGVGGKYPITITAQSANISDVEVKNIRFGSRAANLRKTANVAANYTFEFEIRNDINDTINNIAWNCTNNILSSANFSLAGNQTQYVYPQINFTSPGMKNVTCTVISSEGIESKEIEIEVLGLDAINYDVLAENTSNKVIAFTAKNNYWNSTTNISVTSDSAFFSKNAYIGKDDFVMVISEVEYSSDGAKTYTITLDAGGSNTKTKSVTRKLEGVAIENYTRFDNGVQQHYTFYLRNKWKSGNITWNMSDPSTSAITTVAYNQTLKVEVDYNYTTQGMKKVVLTAQISSFMDKVTDNFEIRPLKIDKLNTLAEGLGTSVTELVVRNNLNQTQYFSWIFNSGTQNLTSSQILNLTTNNIFVYIASNYSTAGVYKTNVMINSSTYRDNQTGVIVT
ncbi:MAG: hypothetical protein Q8R47_01250 [Nanoarchaeota archaeon]|nr:hypothetical protein [Nanoarchaeota archaeon]